MSIPIFQFIPPPYPSSLWISVPSLLSLGFRSLPSPKASIHHYCVSFLSPFPMLLPPVCDHLSLGLYPSLFGFLSFSPG